MSNNTPGTPHRILAGVADNRIARGYLVVCAALLLWVGFDAGLVAHEDASFAGVWPVFATLPTGLALLLVSPLEGAAGTVAYFVLLAVAAVVNSWLFSALLRRWRARTATA
ncbi:SCO4225 family membrane protein [Streptomyces albus]|uniref:SCO4225 family membrane protein n=1 Tax=Streptomyces albus TaxID=1888 RepID=UPI00069094E0|nr:hypothetical protein [Streptomyces albus]